MSSLTACPRPRQGDRACARSPVRRHGGIRPAGPPPQPSRDPVRVQLRVSDTGVVMVGRRIVALGRVHAGKTITIDVSDTELLVSCDD